MQKGHRSFQRESAGDNRREGSRPHLRQAMAKYIEKNTANTFLEKSRDLNLTIQQQYKQFTFRSL